MKPSTTQEKKADKLWNRFNPNNQDKFWKKYEHLLDKNKEPQQASKDHFLTPPTSWIFRPSTSNYAKTLVIILFVSICLIAFGISILQSYGVISLVVPILSFLLVVFFEVRKLNTFQVEDKVFGIYNKLSFTKKHMLWKDIASMRIERKRGQKNETYRVIVIKTKMGKTQKFRFPMSNSHQQEFINLMEAKNIAITDKSDKGGFWSFLMDQI
ncbi:MAG TPA: hypothetical protein DCS93_15820 [Microscillaceae bacterium]|nr:hypothetical protein [Microscillaceae bacterium]